MRKVKLTVNNYLQHRHVVGPDPTPTTIDVIIHRSHGKTLIQHAGDESCDYCQAIAAQHRHIASRVSRRRM